MGLVPVQLSVALGTILKPNKGYPFTLTPAAATIRLAQPREIANLPAHGYRLSVRDVPDDFKKHSDYMIARAAKRFKQSRNLPMQKLRAALRKITDLSLCYKHRRQTEVCRTRCCA